MISTTFFQVGDYNLDLTLSSGQAFRWRLLDGGWEGVVAGRWVRLESEAGGIRAASLGRIKDWRWLADYLQVEVKLGEILKTFPPEDKHLWSAVESCHGLRLLRQEPWECLASFILSSTKQIAHIQQIIERLCERFGAPVKVPDGHFPMHAFPQAKTLALVDEQELRACGMGFRARALREAAQRVATGALDLGKLANMDESQARERLMDLRGVGPKIANCVLLFAYGYPQAFPVDVWVRRALETAYFPRRRLKPREMESFVRQYFGPQAGYAQQYLFHHWRMQGRGRRKAALTAGEGGL